MKVFRIPNCLHPFFKHVPKIGPIGGPYHAAGHGQTVVTDIHGPPRKAASFHRLLGQFGKAKRDPQIFGGLLRLFEYRGDPLQRNAVQPLFGNETFHGGVPGRQRGFREIVGEAVLRMGAEGGALAFALVGHIYDETHTRSLPELGGLAKRLPFIATCGVMAAMASSGLPGFANFVAEMMVIFGSWDRYRLQAVLAVLGIVITSVYMLRMVRGVFFGGANESLAHAKDAATPFARLPYVVLIAALLIVGCWPKPLVRLIDLSTRPLVARTLAPAQPLEVHIAKEQTSITQIVR